MSENAPGAVLDRPIVAQDYVDVEIAATEQSFTQQEIYKPKALAPEELAIEEQIKREFEIRFLGAISMAQTVETVRPDGVTLATAIGRAAEGDKQAEALVDVNVATASSEALFKDGYISTVRHNIEADGKIRQFGLDLHQTHYNSYVLRTGRHDKMREFTLAEALNGYRIQAYADAGLLDDYFVFVPSFVPEDLPEDVLDYRGEGYFTGSMTGALQGTTKENDEIVTETAFRRGTAADAEAPYLTRQAERYDLEAMGMVYEWLGYDPPKTALEFLQRPLLLSKREFPNGVLDILRRFDTASDVLQDKVADRNEAEYANIRLESSLKDASLAGVHAAVKRDLLAAAGTFEAHEDANKLLWDLVRKHAVQDAVKNHLIEPMVFGAKAAPILEAARQADVAGDAYRRDQLLARATESATIAGCGAGSCGLEGLTASEQARAEAISGKKLGEKSVKDTERPCPVCKKKEVIIDVEKDNKTVNGRVCLNCAATDKTAPKAKPAPKPSFTIMRPGTRQKVKIAA